MTDVVVVTPDEAPPEPDPVVIPDATGPALAEVMTRLGEIAGRLEVIEHTAHHAEEEAEVAQARAASAESVAEAAVEVVADAQEAAEEAAEEAEEATDELTDEHEEETPPPPDTPPAREHILHRKFIHFGKGD